MYAGLSEAAKVVVRRAHAGLEGMYPGKMMVADGAFADNAYGRYQLGGWTYMRTIETADSGGRLAALLDPPSAVRDLMADNACDNSITVDWDPPMSFGTVPTTDMNGVYVGPDYIGGEGSPARKKSAKKPPASSFTIQVAASMVGAWSMGSWTRAVHRTPA